MRGQGLIVFLVAFAGLLVVSFALVFVLRQFPGAATPTLNASVTPSPSFVLTPPPTPTPTVTPPAIGTPFLTPTPQLYCLPEEEGTCVGTGLACLRGIRTKDCVKCGCASGSECKIRDPSYGGYDCVQTSTTCRSYNYTNTTWAGVRTSAWNCEFCQYSADCCRVFAGGSVSGENLCLYNTLNHSCTTTRCINQTSG